MKACSLPSLATLCAGLFFSSLGCPDVWSKPDASPPTWTPVRVARLRTTIRYRTPKPFSEDRPIQKSGPVAYDIIEGTSIFVTDVQDGRPGIREFDWSGRPKRFYAMSWMPTAISASPPWLFAGVGDTLEVWQLGRTAPVSMRRVRLPSEAPAHRTPPPINANPWVRPITVGGAPAHMGPIWGQRSGDCYTMLRYGGWPEYELGTDVLAVVPRSGLARRASLGERWLQPPPHLRQLVTVSSHGIVYVITRPIRSDAPCLFKIAGSGRPAALGSVPDRLGAWRAGFFQPYGGARSGVVLWDCLLTRPGAPPGSERRAIAGFEGSGQCRLLALIQPSKPYRYWPLMDPHQCLGQSGALYDLQSVPAAAPPGTPVEFYLSRLAPR